MNSREAKTEAPEPRRLLDRAWLDEERSIRFSAGHNEPPFNEVWSMRTLKCRMGEAWDEDVKRLARENGRLARENTELVGALTAAVAALSNYALALNSAPDEHGRAFEVLHRALNAPR